jgi:predicted small lipoprotein YifL
MRIVLVVLHVLLAGCGTKGALYLPADKPAEQPPDRTTTEPDAQTIPRQGR